MAAPTRGRITGGRQGYGFRSEWPPLVLGAAFTMLEAPNSFSLLRSEQNASLLFGVRDQ